MGMLFSFFSAQLITNPDDSGVINHNDRIPLLPCYDATREPVSG